MRIPTSNSCVGVLVIFLFLFLCVGTASATITYDSGLKLISVENEPCANISHISQEINNTSVITSLGDGVWIIDAGIYSHDSTVYINNSDASEIRITGMNEYGRVLYGWDDTDNFSIHDTVITNWNITTGQPERTGTLILYNAKLYNTTFNSIGLLTIKSLPQSAIHNLYFYNSSGIVSGGVSDLGVNNLVLYDVYLENTSAVGSDGAVCIYNSNNLTVYNITANHTSNPQTNTNSMGFDFLNISHSTFHDLTTIHSGNFLDGDVGTESQYVTGAEGIIFSAGHNNYAYNLSIDICGGSGLCPTGQEHHSVFENVTVNHAGHNGVDIHPAHDIFIDGLTVNDSLAINIMLTMGSGVVGNPYNITIKNVRTHGSGCTPQETNNFTLENASMDMGAVIAVNSSDIKYINVTTFNGTYPLTNYLSFGLLDGHGVSNGAIIDSETYNVGLEENNPTNTSVINCNYSSWVVTHTFEYYYPNIRVENLTGYPVQNAVITVNTTGKNGGGDNQTSYITDANGKLYNSMNRSNWLAVPKTYFENLSSHYDFVTEITATKDGQTDTEIVTPAMLTYSSDISNLQGTEKILVLDVTGSEPEETPILPVAAFSGNVTTGEAPLTVLFTDNSTGSPSSWLWNFGDTTTSELQNPVHTYSQAGVYDVTLTATNINGSDTEAKEDYITATFSGSAPVANFTSNVTNGTVPLKVQFNDSSDNTPTSWAWDFDNNGRIDSTSQNATFRYRTPGNYTANLTVSNGGGSNTTLKYIVAERQPWYIVVWSWFVFGLMGGILPD